jgi:hypothetical protein
MKIDHLPECEIFKLLLKKYKYVSIFDIIDNDFNKNTDQLLDEALQRVYAKIDENCKAKSWWWDMKHVYLPMGIIPYRSLCKNLRSPINITNKGTILVDLNHNL